MSAPVFTQQNTLEKLSGIVKRITFHSVETGWTVLKISPFDRPLLEVAVTVHQSKVFAGAIKEKYMDIPEEWEKMVCFLLTSK